MVFHVYILQSKLDQKYYIGCTNNIERRIKEHNAGKVLSTKYRRPFDLIYSETCITLQDALKMEKYLKNMKRERLRLKIYGGCSSVG